MSFVEWFCRLRIVLPARSFRDNHRVAIPTTVTFLHQDGVRPPARRRDIIAIAWIFLKGSVAWLSEVGFCNATAPTATSLNRNFMGLTTATLRAAENLLTV
jgi:hypothetical protein